MPVIGLSLERLKQFTKNKASEKEILESLPYIGLDIEDAKEDTVTVEYSPNRPDFSSEAGIARSLAGSLNIETGLPKYSFKKSSFIIKIAHNDEIHKERPYVLGLCARILLTEVLIKKLIAMQEDLTNGLGRHRRYLAIGIHNSSAIKPPVRYFSTRDKKYSFVPLDQSRSFAIEEILNQTDQGKQYGGLLSNGIFPLLEDANNDILSMPPVINGESTKLKPGLSEIFVDVTGADKKSCETVVAIMASMLADEGALVSSVTTEDGKSRIQSPDMRPLAMGFDLKLTRDLLGLDLSLKAARVALRKSRLDLVGTKAMIPRFRGDILHPVDLVEELELGWGVPNLKPAEIKSSLVGSTHPRINRIERMIDVLVGLNMTEIANLSLTSKFESAFSITQDRILSVEDAKSSNYEYLRAELAPSLLSVLGSSTHQEYPQRIFEEAPVFCRSEREETHTVEEEHLCAAIADSESNLTSMMSVLNGFTTLVLPEGFKLEPTQVEGDLGVYAGGRSGTLVLAESGFKQAIGHIGEVHPRVLEGFGLKVPVTLFELNIEPLLK
jgi:phenylalanyl-tRNA synthetase beta chain